MARLYIFSFLIALVVYCSVGIGVAGNVIITGNSSSTSVINIDGESVSANCVQGNGVEKSTERSLDVFEKVIVKGAFTVNVTNGKTPDFTIRGDENIIDHIVSKVDGDTLQVYPDRSICPVQNLEVDISLQNIVLLSAMGTMQVELRGVNGNMLTIEIDGSSGVVAEGTTDTLTTLIEGSGQLQAGNLKSTTAKLRINGVGNAYVHVSDLLDVSIQGVGNVYYQGNPQKVQQNISGIGSVIAQ